MRWVKTLLERRGNLPCLRVLDTLKATDPTTGKHYSLKAAARLHKVFPFQIRQWRKQREQGEFETIPKSKKTLHSGMRPRMHGIEHDLLEFVKDQSNAKKKLIVWDSV
jgi:hypothetical protein